LGLAGSENAADHWENLAEASLFRASEIVPPTSEPHRSAHQVNLLHARFAIEGKANHHEPIPTRIGEIHRDGDTPTFLAAAGIAPAKGARRHCPGFQKSPPPQVANVQAH
jgi:hypothetical protein